MDLDAQLQLVYGQLSWPSAILASWDCTLNLDQVPSILRHLKSYPVYCGFKLFVGKCRLHHTGSVK